MTMRYPDVEGFAYSFERAELTLGRRIYVAISNVEIDQPTESAAVHGTRPYPIMESVGRMDLGEGTVTWSDEGERVAFLTSLGDGYREVKWPLMWVKSAPNKPVLKYIAYGCRVLGNPVSDEGGSDALGGDMTFSFMYYTINGKVPHKGLPAPTR